MVFTSETHIDSAKLDFHMLSAAKYGQTANLG
jgi:hypothetical protein